MKAVTVQKSIIFRTNEYSETPESVRISFTPETLHRIATIQNLIIEHKLYSVKIDIPKKQFTLLLADDEDDIESDWIPSEQTFIIYESRFYFYAQSKYDATDQIESEEMDFIEIMQLFSPELSNINL